MVCPDQGHSVLRLLLRSTPVLLAAGCGPADPGSEVQVDQGMHSAAACGAADCATCSCDARPHVGGQWSEPVETDIVGIHTTLLPSGKVLFFGFTDTSDGVGQSSVFDPATGAVEPTALAVGTDLPNKFCSGHAILPDGRVYVAGGHVGGAHSGHGSHTFDPSTLTWTSHGSLASLGGDRWYPTVTTLPDGQAFVISGTGNFGGGPHDDKPCRVNNTWQLFNPATNTVTAQFPLPFGPVLTPSFSCDPRELEAEPFSPDFSAVDLYPFVYVVPSGRHRGKLMVHSRQTTRFFDVTTEQWSGRFLTVSPDSRTYNVEGSSLMLMLRPHDSHRARVLVIGGGAWPPSETEEAKNSVEMLDLGAHFPAWRNVAPMGEPRVMPDSVLLPDGQVFVVSGSRTGKADHALDPVFTPEIYDPATNRWTTLCPMRVPRLYHSTALLLPDGRVLVAGRDGLFNAGQYNCAEHRVEIFSPPYLFRGPRPVLRAVPSRLRYGAHFRVGVGGVRARGVDHAVLLRLGSVTHSFNMNQRGIELEIVRPAAHGLTLRAPPNRLVAPPGHYMLFVLSRGVPSVASIVTLE